jgi:hypothetical protein
MVDPHIWKIIPIKTKERNQGTVCNNTDKKYYQRSGHPLKYP